MTHVGEEQWVVPFLRVCLVCVRTNRIVAFPQRAPRAVCHVHSPADDPIVGAARLAARHLKSGSAARMPRRWVAKLTGRIVRMPSSRGMAHCWVVAERWRRSPGCGGAAKASRACLLKCGGALGAVRCDGADTPRVAGAETGRECARRTSPTRGNGLAYGGAPSVLWLPPCSR